MTNSPKQRKKILSIHAYKNLLNALKNLRIEGIARQRLQDFDKSEAISHKDLLKKFEGIYLNFKMPHNPKD